MEEHMLYKKVGMKYREFLKNHAATVGGNAPDGCGEFMPSGEDGTLEALKCSACNCHRNFHRKEIEGESSFECYHHLNKMERNTMVGHHKVLGSEGLGYRTGTLISSRAPPSHHMVMSYFFGGSIASESDEQDGGGVGVVARPPQKLKKRFRTKFTHEQKEKMLSFAEKVGWRIHKQEESEVLQFSQEIGVKRRVQWQQWSYSLF